MGIFNQKPDVAAMWKAKDRDGLMKALEYADDNGSAQCRLRISRSWV